MAAPIPLPAPVTAQTRPASPSQWPDDSGNAAVRLALKALPSLSGYVCIGGRGGRAVNGQ